MASNGNILSMFSEADTNTKLYQWMTNRPKDPSSDTLKEVYNEQAYYYEEFMCSKLGWLGWKVGAEFLHNQLEKFGFQKEIHILDAGSGTGLVGMIYLIRILKRKPRSALVSNEHIMVEPSQIPILL